MATVLCLLAALLAAQACGESIHRPGMKPTIKRVPSQLKILIPNIVYAYSANKQMTVIAKELRERGHEVVFCGVAELKKMAQTAGFRYIETLPAWPEYKSILLDAFLPPNYFKRDLASMWDVTVGLRKVADLFPILYAGAYNATLKTIRDEKPDIIFCHRAFTPIIELLKTFDIPHVLFNPFPLGNLMFFDTFAAPSSEGGNAATIKNHLTSLWERLKKPAQILMYIKALGPTRKRFNAIPTPNFLGSPVIHPYLYGPMDVPRYLSPLVCKTSILVETAFEQLGEDIESWPEEEKRLVEELNSISKTSNGFIYMAMGTLLCDDDSLPIVIQGAMDYVSASNMELLVSLRENCRSKVPAQVLGSPKVTFKAWVNQDVVLGHSGAKAFISHGGISSIAEAIVNRVPLLLIPVFNDQMPNSVRAVESGIALRVDRRRTSSVEISEKLRRIIQESSFMDNILKAYHLSAIGTQGKVSAADFIEEIAVLGHEHLVPIEDRAPFYIRHGLDVLFIMVFIPITVLIFALRTCFWSIYGIFCGGSNKNEKIKEE
ncbi:hypothetical protein AAMO2058_000378000 [Amorphochlora amoebiformis]